jgi:hypothetical protein
MTTPEFRPPDLAYAQAVEWNWATDPLSNGPGLGVSGWFHRVGGIFRRSGKRLLLIFVILQLVPAVFFAVISVLAAVNFLSPLQKELQQSTVEQRNPTFDLDTSKLWPLVGAALVGGLIFLFLQAAGYAAATHSATRQAAGIPTTLGESLAYGFRRCAGLAGWIFLVGLLTALGTVACILPGFYVLAATALVGPIFIFERHAPISRSFRIFNQNLGRILGRLALTAVIYYGCAIVVSIAESIANAILGSTDPTLNTGAAIGVSIGGTILTIPITIFMFACILVTYAEQRAYEGPTPATTLAAEL